VQRLHQRAPSSVPLAPVGGKPVIYERHEVQRSLDAWLYFDKLNVQQEVISVQKHISKASDQKRHLRIHEFRISHQHSCKILKKRIHAEFMLIGIWKHAWCTCFAAAFDIWRRTRPRLYLNTIIVAIIKNVFLIIVTLTIAAAAATYSAWACVGQRSITADSEASAPDTSPARWWHLEWSSVLRCSPPQLWVLYISINVLYFLLWSRDDDDDDADDSVAAAAAAADDDDAELTWRGQLHTRAQLLFGSPCTAEYTLS
jgi:hypothetical protein